MNLFTKCQRLLTPREFTDVFAQGFRLHTADWTLVVLPTDRGYPRLGLAVAKKAIRRAVGRNRVKRLVRESFRQYDQLPSVDIVFVAKAAVGNLSNHKIREQLQSCWHKLIKRCNAPPSS